MRKQEYCDFLRLLLGLGYTALVSSASSQYAYLEFGIRLQQYT